MNTLTGGCMCGEVRFEINNEPMAAVLCHCKDCQKLSGSAFSSGLCFPKDSLHFKKIISVPMSMLEVQAQR